MRSKSSTTPSQPAVGSRPQIVIWGARPTGHGLVVLDALLERGEYHVAGFLDDNPDRHGAQLHGVPVLGGRALLPELAASGVGLLFPAVGDNALRLQMLREARQAGLEAAVVVHPFACVSPLARLSAGAFVAAGAVIAPGADIGECAIVNTSASIDHNCVLGPGSNVCPGAHLAGRVTLGEGAFIGTGASVIPDVTVGAWAVVGAGACVVRDVPDGVTVVGVPAAGRT